jgi:hypothetical protein
MLGARHRGVSGREGRPDCRLITALTPAAAERQQGVSVCADADAMTDNDTLIRQFIGGDPNAATQIAALARTSGEPMLLVTAALAEPRARELLTLATQLASSSRDRQLVAIAAAHLDGDTERVDVLARDHLADHPDSLLVAWIADRSRHLEGNPS